MKFNYVLLAGGLSTIVSLFLPAIEIMGIKANLFDGGSGVGIFYIILGVVAIIASLVGKKWLNAISMILGLIVLALAIVYLGDAQDAGISPGIGIWMLLIGGALTIIGNVVGMIMKKGATSDNVQEAQSLHR